MGDERPLIGIVGLGGVGEALLRRLHNNGHNVIGIEENERMLAWVCSRLSARLPATLFSADPSALATADVIIDTTPDTGKVELVQRLDKLSRPEAIMMISTSSLSAAAVAAVSGRPSNIVGWRFPLPPPAGKIVELLRTPLTSQESVDRAEQLVSLLGLEIVTPAATAADAANALVFGYLNDAVNLVSQRYVSCEDIDLAMRLGCGLPAGPLQLLDMMGIDVAYETLSALAKRTGDTTLRPAPLLRRMIQAGRYGQRTGHGFHTYDDQGERVVAAGVDSAEESSVVHRVGVLGSGTMARGIAEMTASAGYPTVLVGRTEERCAQAHDAIAAALRKAVRRGRIDPQREQHAIALLETCVDPTVLSDCDLVIEAVAEDLAVKKSTFAMLDQVCKPDTILATTTSSLAVTACADATSRPTRVLGLHFFNPAPIMRLVEVSRTNTTDDEVMAAALSFCRRLGKSPIECTDRAGFIVNYLLFPYLRRAIDLLDRPDTDVEAIDNAVKAGFSYPMGPFGLLDTIGLDVCLAIQNRLFDEFRTPAHKPSPILEGIVAAGYLGNKNGRGFTNVATGVPYGRGRLGVS